MTSSRDARGELAVPRSFYLILAAGAAVWDGKNPTARHLMMSIPGPPGAGIAPDADDEEDGDRL